MKHLTASWIRPSDNAELEISIETHPGSPFAVFTRSHKYGPSGRNTTGGSTEYPTMEAARAAYDQLVAKANSMFPRKET